MWKVQYGFWFPCLWGLLEPWRITCHFPFSDANFHEVRAHRSTFNFCTLGPASHSDDCKTLYAFTRTNFHFGKGRGGSAYAVEVFSVLEMSSKQWRQWQFTVVCSEQVRIIPLQEGKTPNLRITPVQMNEWINKWIKLTKSMNKWYCQKQTQTKYS